jgi:hypothetical protein
VRIKKRKGGRTLVCGITKDVDRDTDVMGDKALVVEWIHNSIESLEEGQKTCEE